MDTLDEPTETNEEVEAMVVAHDEPQVETKEEEVKEIGNGCAEIEHLHDEINKLRLEMGVVLGAVTDTTNKEPENAEKQPPTEKPEKKPKPKKKGTTKRNSKKKIKVESTRPIEKRIVVERPVERTRKLILEDPRNKRRIRLDTGGEEFTGRYAYDEEDFMYDDRYPVTAQYQAPPQVYQAPPLPPTQAQKVHYSPYMLRVKRAPLRHNW
jgi:hypothetical protein